MSRNLRYRYTVKVLTPLHIGSGETIPGLAYHVSNFDSPSCFWTLLDLEAAAPEWARLTGRTDFDVDAVAEFARKHRGPYRKYILQVSPAVARFLQQNRQPRPRILEQIKLNSKPYLPGSSLKGAIRTAVLDAFLSQQNKGEEFVTQLRSSLNNESVTKTHLDDVAEQAVWSSDPHHDPLRGLRINDSEEKSPREHLTIFDMRVMGFNINPKLELFWEKFSSRTHEDSYQKVPPTLFLEMFLPGTTLEGELSFNTFLLEQMKEKLNFQGKAEILSLEQLSKECQRKYGVLFRRELGLYTALNKTGQLKDVVANLLAILQKVTIGENEFLLQIAYGTGWQAKTVADQLEPDFLRDEVNQIHRVADFRTLTLGQQDFLSPKTRRLVMEDGTPAWPMGWVKVKLEKAA